MISLTPPQRELLVYINARETCPSYREMQVALGLSSKSSIQRLLAALEERGYIRRHPGRARAIEVIHHPPAPPRVVYIPLSFGINANDRPRAA